MMAHMLNLLLRKTIKIKKYNYLGLNMINEESVDNQEIETTEFPQDEMPQEDIQTVEESPQQEPVQANSDLDENIKLLRESKKREQERAERAEFERDQMMKYVQSLNNPQAVQQPQQQPKTNSLNLSKDDFVEPEHVNHIQDSVEGLRQEVNEWKMRNEETTADLKLRSEFDDFNNIVTSKNVEDLLGQYPEMSEIVRGQAPLYTRGKATYRLIKKFMSEQANKAVNQNTEKTIQNNFNKPRPAVSVTPAKSADSQLNYANLFSNGYTEDVSKFLRKQMDDAIERYNNKN